MTTFQPLREQSPRRVSLPSRQRLIGSRTARDHEPNTIKQSGGLAYVVRRDANGRLRLAPAWPLWALLVPFPLWWALGMGSFAFALFAIPMALRLAHQPRIRVPRGWWLWALFLLWRMLSLVMLGETPAGLHAGSLGGRVISNAVGIIELASATVTLLFVGNLSRAELPIDRLMRWLGALCVTTIAGGVLGTVAPHFGFTSPLEFLLPQHIRSNPYVAALVHPNAAQVQSTADTGQSGRAAAPFGYTNFWANNLSLLIVWFVCSWTVKTSVQRRVACFVLVAVAVLPIVDSVNRGLWLGLAFSIVWVALRLFRQGRVAALFAVLIATAIGFLLFIGSPLRTTFEARLANPGSTSLRQYLTDQSIAGTLKSPILGWGDSRKTNGSNRSVAVGKSAACPQCGEFPVGSNGQLWATLFDNGIVGTVFYFGFFGATVWFYRRDLSPPGQAGVLVVALTFVYMLFYNSLPFALTITMISVGILWRLEADRAGARESVQPDPVAAAP